MRIAVIWGKAILLVVVSAIIGFLLLALVFMLPMNRIEHNVKASAEIFEQEGTWPKLKRLGITGTVDNFTDALMLLSAGYTQQTDVLDRVIKIYRPGLGDEDPTEVIVAWAEEQEQLAPISYERYWHGYLLILKPLLIFFTYGQIRILNAVMVAFSTVVLCALLYRKRQGRYIIPYLLAFLLINPCILVRSMQFVTVYYLYVIASIVLLAKLEWLDAEPRRLLWFFVLTGCATSYFDLLTYPLVTFGVPATFYLCATYRSWRRTANTLFVCLVGWLLGYGGMWSGKWILGTLISGENIISNVRGSISYRSSMTDEAGQAFSRIGILTRQFSQVLGPALILVLIYFLVVAFFCIRKRQGGQRQEPFWVLFLMIAILPILWLFALSNHSYVHYWFTYRELLIAALALLCLPTYYLSGKLPAGAQTIDVSGSGSSNTV